MKENLNLREVAMFLNCSISTVRNLIRAKSIPYHKIGAKYYFSIEKVKAWIDSNEE